MSAVNRKAIVPALNRPLVSNPSDVQKFIDKVFTTLQVGTGRTAAELDRWLTARDLYEAGLVRLVDGQGVLEYSGENSTGFEPIPAVETPPDLTTPPAPTGLSVTGGIAIHILQWTAAGYGNHAYTEIWRNTTNNQGTAVLVGTTQAAIYADPVGYNSDTKYYWIRFVSTANVVGPYNATGGTSSTTQSGGSDPDTTAPGAITNLAAVGSVKSIILTWTLPSDHDIDVVQVYRHTSDVRASATKVAEVKGTIYADPVAAGSTYYYWVRAIDSSANVGDWNASAGVSATTGTVSSSDLAYGAVLAEKLADSSVITSKFAPGAVDNTALANLAVDAAKLATGAVTETKIGALAVGYAAIQSGAIGTAHIQEAAIQTALIGDLQVSNAKIADGAITNVKIQDATIQGAKIATATIDDAKISTVSAAKLTAGSITSGVVNVGDDRLQLDGTGTNRHILVRDNQGSPVNRVKIGKLGAGATDYGIQIFDASGNPVIALDGTVSGAKVDGLSASKILAGSITAAISIYSPYISTQSAGSTAARVVLDSAGGDNLPFWFGSNAKSTANGVFYLDVSGGIPKVVVNGKIFSVEGQIAGFVLSASTLTAGSGNNVIKLDSAGVNPAIAVGNATPTSAPFRVMMDGTMVATSASILSGTSGKRITINESGNNEAKFYGDRGDGTVVELASIGIKTVGVDEYVGYFGDANSTHIGVGAYSKTNHAVYGQSDTASGVFGFSTYSHGVLGVSTSDRGVFGSSINGDGVYGVSTNECGVVGLSYAAGKSAGKFLDSSSSGFGVQAYSIYGYGVDSVSSHGYGARFESLLGPSPLYISPSTSTNAPMHSAFKGSLWVDANAVVHINTSSAGVWSRIGDQYKRFAGYFSAPVDSILDFPIPHGLGTDDVICDFMADSSSHGEYHVMMIRPDMKMAQSRYGTTSEGPSMAAVSSGQVLLRACNFSGGTQTISVSYIIRPRIP